MLLGALTFILTLLADVCWTQYNMRSAEKRAHPAAFWSALIVAVGGLNVLLYTTSHWLLIPAILGAYLGTWVTIWYENRRASR